MNRFVHSRTDMALCALIQNSLEVQALQRNRRERIGPLHYLKQICQVRLTGPRGSGHTTAALRVCGDIFENPLYVALTHDMGEDKKRYAKEMGINNFTFTSRRSLTRDIISRSTIDAIVVDPAFDMTPSFEEDLFRSADALARCQDEFCIILMG